MSDDDIQEVEEPEEGELIEDPSYPLPAVIDVNHRMVTTIKAEVQLSKTMKLVVKPMANGDLKIVIRKQSNGLRYPYRKSWADDSFVTLPQIAIPALAEIVKALTEQTDAE